MPATGQRRSHAMHERNEPFPLAWPGRTAHLLFESPFSLFRDARYLGEDVSLYFRGLAVKGV